MDIQPYKGPNRRKHPRTHESFIVPFRLYDAAGTSLTFSGQAWLRDLSFGGLCLALQGAAGPFSLARSQPVRIDCRLTAGEESTAWLKGHTVWLSQVLPIDKSGTQHPHYVGIAWEDGDQTASVISPILERSAAPAHSSREQLAALLEVSHLLTSSTDLGHLLHLILETVSRLLHAEGSSLLLLDSATQELVFQVPFNPGSELLQGLRLQPGEGIAGWVAKTRQPHLSNEVQKDARFASKYDAMTGFKTRSMLAMPLLDRGQLLGVIEVINSRRPTGFTPDEQDLLSAFAVHAAVALRNAQLVSTIKEEKDYWQNKTEDRYRSLIGESLPMKQAIQVAKKAATSSATILLLGESGVGKEIFARSIVGWSPRSSKPFRTVNCAALSENLLESELFGHEKGAFTGAQQLKKGLFELADGGTVFLDEIGEMKPDLQAKLLRVLQDREFQRVGGSQSIVVDIRIIAATNQDLAAAVQAGRFRKDLFYRLNVVTLTLPPLRERPEDIAPLAQHLLNRCCRDMMRSSMTLSEEALATLLQYHWPGNVREMENVIERAAILAPESVIQPADIVLEKPRTGSGGQESLLDLTFHDSIEEHKRALIQHAIAKSGGNKSKAALALKLQPNYLFRLCKQVGPRRRCRCRPPSITTYIYMRKHLLMHGGWMRRPYFAYVAFPLLGTRPKDGAGNRANQEMTMIVLIALMGWGFFLAGGSLFGKALFGDD
jgi:transcriptional regulator with GAF, ATPase, and Fis domain